MFGAAHMLRMYVSVVATVRVTGGVLASQSSYFMCVYVRMYVSVVATVRVTGGVLASQSSYFMCVYVRMCGCVGPGGQVVWVLGS